MSGRPGEPLALVGDPLERGRLQAVRRPDAAPAVREAVAGRLARAAGATRREGVPAYLADQRRFAAAHHPEALAELAGIAGGFGLAEGDLFTYLHLGTIADLTATGRGASAAPAEADGCTAWAATLPAGGGALVGKNRDFRGEHLALQQVFRHVDPAWPRAREVLCVGSLGSPGAYSSGINSDGLVVADTQIATDDHGIGWLRYFLMTRLLAACGTVDEALGVIGRATHAGGGSLVLADRAGAVAAVELGHRTVAVERGGPGAAATATGWVARTNHFLSAGLKDHTLRDDAREPMGRTSPARLATVRRALVAAGAGIRDVPRARAVMSAHTRGGSGGGEGLCRHGEDGDARTISTSVYATGPMTLDFSAGSPCTAAWFRYALSSGGWTFETA